MNYRLDKYGNRLSILGYGCLRFPQKRGKIDLEETEKQILEAVRGGVNYFDTAYIYNGSEAALGEILERNSLRDQVYIATKLPHYLIKSREGMEKLFNEELRRLRTDHVDYYLMHMLTDIAAWERMKALGIEQWLAEKKRTGAIRQIGFSYHGNSEMFCRLVDAWDWDFCQIQYNYMDEHSQAGRRGLYHASAKGIPVIIMEPLRGGRLANMLPQQAVKRMKAYDAASTPAQWALRWLWDQPEVTVVLSGMNSMQMVKENVATASGTQPGCLTEEDRQLLQAVVKDINATLKVGCTGCGYCMPCPMQVDIPGTFSAYNRYHGNGKFVALKEYMMCTTLRKTPTTPSNCVGCGKCEQHCPQGIKIRAQLKEAQKTLETPIYKLARWLAPKIVKF